MEQNNLRSVSIYTDGGSRGNPGPSAIGILIYSPDEVMLKHHREYIGTTTNNQAEYAAIQKALELAGSYTNGEVKCFSDSKLMVNQLSGSFKVKNLGLKEALLRVKAIESKFSSVEYKHVSRNDPRIKQADALVNKSLDEQEHKKCF